MLPKSAGFRVASYNVRVDHTDDLGTEHDWALRRPLVASSIAALRADVIGLQEPSPVQAEHMQEDLGDEWGVAVLACDPEAWAAAPAAEGPAAQARDGNGIAWRRARLALLSEVEELPLPSDSGFKRSCVVARMRDRITGSALRHMRRTAQTLCPRPELPTAPVGAGQLLDMPSGLAQA